MKLTVQTLILLRKGIKTRDVLAKDIAFTLFLTEISKIQIIFIIFAK